MLDHSAASGLDGTLLFLVVEAGAVFSLGRESRNMLKHWEGKGVKMGPVGRAGLPHNDKSVVFRVTAGFFVSV